MRLSMASLKSRMSLLAYDPDPHECRQALPSLWRHGTHQALYKLIAYVLYIVHARRCCVPLYLYAGHRHERDFTVSLCACFTLTFLRYNNEHRS